MRRSHRGLAVVILAASILLASPATGAAQDVGTVTWQLPPFCSTLTVTVTGASPIFQIAGYLDSCGGEVLYPAFGTAVGDVTGTMRMGLTVVLPSAVTTSLHLTIDPATGAGTWTEPLGQSGSLVPVAFVPATPPAASAR